MPLSPTDQRQLDRKARELNMKEDKIARMEQQVRRNDERVRERAKEVEDRGKEFLAKERALREQVTEIDKKSRLLDDDRQSFVSEKEEHENANKMRLMIIIPILLVAAVASGYLVFDFKAKDNFFYDQFQTASENIEKLNEAYGELDKQKLQLHTEFSEQKMVVDELRKSLASKESDFDKVSSAKRSLQLKYDDAKKRARIFDTKAKELEADKERLREELGRLAAEKVVLNEDLEGLEFKLTALGTQLLEEKKQHQETASGLLTTEESLINATAELEESRQLNRQMQKELDGLIARYEEQQSQLTAAENASTAKQGDLVQREKAITDLSRQVVALKKDIQSKVDLIEAKETLLTELQARVDELTSARSGLETESAKLSQTVSSETQARTKAEAQIEKLLAELITVSRERDDLSNQQKALNDAITAEKAANTELRSQLSALEKELQAGVEALQRP